jgi:hypothetical protein
MPGQAFMVRALSNGVSASFKTTMQKHGPGTFYKEQKNWVETFFTLYSTEANLKNDIKIAFNDDMTNGLDVSYDVGKFKGNPKIAFYSNLVDGSYADVDFTTQALPFYFEDPVSVNIGFDIADPGEYTIKLKDFKCNFDSSAYAKVRIELEDTYEDKIVDIKNSSYTFETEGGTFKDRFILHYNRNITSTNELTGDHNEEGEGFSVYNRPDNSIVINNITNRERENVQIKVYDLLGKVVYEKTVSFSAGEMFVTGLINHKGICVVEVRDAVSAYAKKVVLK